MTECNHRELLEKIRNSAGLRFINEKKLRSFSWNIFSQNTKELIKLAQAINDPEYGFHLMIEDNRDEGTQAHRELSRLVHNFVASALTLVDHTRVFMREKYDGTTVKSEYDKLVKSQYANAPLVKFVQDLRNYMVHKALPPSQMTMHLSQNPQGEERGFSMTTSASFPTEKLLEWNGWTSLSNRYITSSGKEINVLKFCKEYYDKIEIQHSWLEKELDTYHKNDLTELFDLQKALADFDENMPRKNQEITFGTYGSEGEVSKNISVESIDLHGRELLKSLCFLDLDDSPENSFSGDRPIVAITQEQIIGSIRMTCLDKNENQVTVLGSKNNAPFGYHMPLDVLPLAEMICKFFIFPSITNNYWSKIIEKWLSISFLDKNSVTLSEYIADHKSKYVCDYRVLIPLSFEIEIPFSMGDIQIISLSKRVLDEIENNLSTSAPNEKDKTEQLFQSIREKMQGLSALELTINSDPDYALQIAEEFALDASGYLRFLYTPSFDFDTCSALTPLGMERIPQKYSLIISDSTFSFQEGIAHSKVSYSRVSKETIIKNSRVHSFFGYLINNKRLTEFEATIKTSLTLFSNATASAIPFDRLIYTLLSAEEALIRHKAEEIKFSVEQRLSKFLSQNESEYMKISATIRTMYRIKNYPDRFTILGHIEQCRIFTVFVHRMLIFLINQHDTFLTKSDFIDYIERKPYAL